MESVRAPLTRPGLPDLPDPDSQNATARPGLPDLPDLPDYPSYRTYPTLPGVSRNSTTPWLGIDVEYLSNVSRSFCAHTSCALYGPHSCRSWHWTVTFAAASPRLNNPTACAPPAIGFVQISTSPS